jgi:hypothetical protein
MSSPSSSIWIHATDVLDEGPDAVFAAVKAMGVGEISFAATYHGARYLLPHSPKATVREYEDGAAWYAPDPKRFEKLRLKPKLADACRGEDLCRKVRDAAAKAGIAANAWLVGLHDSRLGAAHPDCTIVNCFGESYPWGLCPSHPDVRAYAATLAEDVAMRLAPAAIELEAFGFMGYGHTSHHDKAGVKLDGAHDFLLSVCFCQHCTRRMQSRDLDAKKLAEKARRLVKDYLDRGGPEAGNPRLEKPEEIGPWLTKQLGAKECAALLSVRKEVVVSLVEDVRKRVPPEIELTAMVHPSPFKTGSEIGGGLLALGDVVDAFVLNLFHGDVAKMRAEVKSARTAATPETRFFVNLRAFAPDSENEASFREKAKAVTDEGAAGLRIYHYGLMPRANFPWVRAALASLVPGTKPSPSANASDDSARGRRG